MLSFVESKPIAKEISAKFPFGVKEGKKKHYNVRVYGTHVEVTDSSGHVVVQADAETNPLNFYVAQFKLYGSDFIVELYGHFVQIISIARQDETSSNRKRFRPQREERKRQRKQRRAVRAVRLHSLRRSISDFVSKSFLSL